MNTPTAPKPSVQQRVTLLEDNIVRLDRTIQVVAQQADASLAEAHRQLGQLVPANNAQAAVINALVEILGQDEVQRVMERQQREQEIKDAEAKKSALKEAVVAGRLVAVTKVDEESVIEGVEFGADNQPVHPGYMQFTFQKVLPELRERVLGKTVGERVETAKEGHTFLIEGIWHLVQPVPPPEGGQPTAAAQEAPAAPAQPAEQPVAVAGEGA